MNDIQLVSAWGIQTNPSYNPDTAYDGGGYFQAEGGALIRTNGRNIAVEVADISCGGFGSRVFATVDAGSRLWHMCIGTMGDASIDNEEAEQVLDSIAGVLGVDAGELALMGCEAANVMANVYEEMKNND